MTACLLRDGWAPCCRVWQTTPCPTPPIIPRVRGPGFGSETQQKAPGRSVLTGSTSRGFLARSQEAR